MVSFGLALWVALRSRQVRFTHGWRLTKALVKRFFQGPVTFLIGARAVPALPFDEPQLLEKTPK